MRRLLPLSLLLVVMLLVPGSAMADLLTFNQLDPNTWQLIVNRPADKAIGGFDVFLGYDGSTFTPVGVDPGPYLGDPLLFESIFDVFFDVNELEISQVSLLSNAYLISTQPLSFVLATIHFDLPGDPRLVVLGADVSDGFGNPIGEAPIPEPGTMLLLGTGLAALARWRKKLV